MDFSKISISGRFLSSVYKGILDQILPYRPTDVFLYLELKDLLRLGSKYAKILLLACIKRLPALEPSH